MSAPLPFREISPAVGMSAEEFWTANPPPLRAKITQIRRQKAANTRKKPSTSILDQSKLLTQELRGILVDRVGALVDENVWGRSEMCIQFADLLVRALSRLNLPARAAVGKASYQRKNGTWFTWDHAWVLVSDELIDANVDSLDENIMVPSDVRPRPYWGPLSCLPVTHQYKEEASEKLPLDTDVQTIWWPELEKFLGELPPDSLL